MPSNGVPITLVSATLGHADLITTSVYAHARLGESSGRYLKAKFEAVPEPTPGI
jgi:site-specific recombinase XerD